MSDNTVNKTENKEQTSYQKLLKSLDDDNFARTFKAQKLERCKDLISDILSVTCGNSIVTEHNSEYGHGCLLELLETLQIRHNNFFLPDFLDELKRHIFAWSITHDKINSEWQNARLAERGLDEYGIEFGATIEQTETERSAARTLTEHHLEIMANKISHILQSDKVSDDVKTAFDSIIVEAGNEAGISGNHAKLIKTSLPLIIESVGLEYGKGVLHSLRALIDSGLVDSIEDELRQYEKRFDGREAGETGNPILDLSNSSTEDLAKTLSDIMHNPNLPKAIYDCLVDNLNVNHIDVYSPENILGNLENLKKEN